MSYPSQAEGLVNRIIRIYQNPKILTFILLCCYIMSELNVGGMAVEDVSSGQ